MHHIRGLVIWTALFIVLALPVYMAVLSPLLAWREPVYIIAGLAGVAALSLLLLQPLLATAVLPGITITKSKQIHRLTGTALLVTVIVHVAGLWITSPYDVIDALLFSSPTPFSVWGVIAMWALFASAALVIWRRRIALTQRAWQLMHKLLALIIAAGTVAHALLIEGTMEVITKAALCAVVIGATLFAFVRTSFRKKINL